MKDWITQNRCKISNILDFFFTIVLLYVGAYFKTFLCFWEYNNIRYYFVIFNILSFIIIIIKFCYTIFLQPNLEENYNELNNKYKNTIQLLTSMANNLGIILDNLVEECFNTVIYSEQSKTRLTLYLISNNYCYAIYRYSNNPNLKNISKTPHSLDKGCLKYGYEKGWYFDDSFPDPNNIREYNNYLRQPHLIQNESINFNFNHADCNKLKHRCSIYAVKRIDKSSKCIGLLTLESTTKKAFTETAAKRALDMYSIKIRDVLNIHMLYVNTIPIIQKDKSK